MEDGPDRVRHPSSARALAYGCSCFLRRSSRTSCRSGGSGLVNFSGYGANYADAVYDPQTMFEPTNYKNTTQGHRLKAFEDIDADPNQEIIVAEKDGVVVGTMQLSYIPGIAFRGASRGLLEAVRVSRALRGQGVGREMIAWANARFRSRGCRIAQLMSLQSRTDAHRFYEQLGWNQSHYGFKYTLGEK